MSRTFAFPHGGAGARGVLGQLLANWPLPVPSYKCPIADLTGRNGSLRRMPHEGEVVIMYKTHEWNGMKSDDSPYPYLYIILFQLFWFFLLVIYIMSSLLLICELRWVGEPGPLHRLLFAFAPLRLSGLVYFLVLQNLPI